MSSQVQLLASEPVGLDRADVARLCEEWHIRDPRRHEVTAGGISTDITGDWICRQSCKPGMHIIAARGDDRRIVGLALLWAQAEYFPESVSDLQERFAACGHLAYVHPIMVSRERLRERIGAALELELGVKCYHEGVNTLISEVVLAPQPHMPALTFHVRVGYEPSGNKSVRCVDVNGTSVPVTYHRMLRKIREMQ